MTEALSSSSLARPTDPSDSRVPVVVVGAGGMGRAWIRTVLDSDAARLVGVADVVPGAAERAVQDMIEDPSARERIAVGTDGTEIALATVAEAVIDVTVPEAHHTVTAAALQAGLHVLGEKPCAATLAEAVSLAGHAEASGKLFMVSQSRRYNPHLHEARRLADALGGAGIVATRFFKAPHFGGFRDEMRHPLIVDMAIHAFDAARVLIEGSPVAVRAISHNPSWSWYAGDAAATVHVTYDSGAVHAFTGSWCSPGQETSWNGDWRISCAGGTVTWDGETVPRSVAAEGETVEGAAPSAAERWELAGSLADFCAALRGGPVPAGEVHGNVWTQAIVEAAVRSADEDRTVQLAEVLDKALAQAREMPGPEAVSTALSRWEDGASGLRAG
ncbi:Gfo/Idh/MocA family protein [Brachybacterium sp. J153]|uniref:Gfo/Idh/MocA family protein n=1 Tax=Brachybacterium sp. J153 TaxID=3116488 RepID=UPI002E78C7FB|nr:Gfo/Idh/MocA family oxidoreductase [Brachybacterium sp. J153]MEE1618666.1 Gfo/Idh/MocA family oxidoreductase [Brachybacterium sp. J153]